MLCRYLRSNNAINCRIFRSKPLTILKRRTKLYANNTKMFRSSILGRSTWKVAQAARNMSGSAETAQVETFRWKKASFGMMSLSILFGIYNVVFHDHVHADRTDLPFLKNRSKPYPWECSDCNLFDGECWDACRGIAPKENHH